mgnify:CR=1 FL=1
MVSKSKHAIILWNFVLKLAGPLMHFILSAFTTRIYGKKLCRRKNQKHRELINVWLIFHRILWRQHHTHKIPLCYSLNFFFLVEYDFSIFLTFNKTHLLFDVTENICLNLTVIQATLLNYSNASEHIFFKHTILLQEL